MRKMFWFGTCTSKARLDGKTAVITGCTTGIGKETAEDFVKRGARVIMACRNLKKAKEAASDIRKKTENCEGVGVLVIVKLDLASFSSIRKCAQHLLNTENHIHLLINNAGMISSNKTLTKDGFEMQFAVNHLGHFLLTCLLIPRIMKSAPARIVTLSSMGYIFGSINFDDLNSEKSYSPFFAYCQSKLANILFTMELAKRMKGTGVTTYCVHPGINTQIVHDLCTQYFAGITWLTNCLASFYSKSLKQGAQTTIYCAVEESISEESGFYYRDCQRCVPFAKACDSDVASRLWTESVKFVGLKKWNPFTAKDTPPKILSPYVK